MGMMPAEEGEKTLGRTQRECATAEAEGRQRTSEVVMERAMQYSLGGLLICSPRALASPVRRGIRRELMVSFHIHHSRLLTSCRVQGFHFSSRPVPPCISHVIAMARGSIDWLSRQGSQVSSPFYFS